MKLTDFSKRELVEMLKVINNNEEQLLNLMLFKRFENLLKELYKLEELLHELEYNSTFNKILRVQFTLNKTGEEILQMKAINLKKFVDEKGISLKDLEKQTGIELKILTKMYKDGKFDGNEIGVNELTELLQVLGLININDLIPAIK